MIRLGETSRTNLDLAIAEFISKILDPRVLFSPTIIALAIQGSTNHIVSLGWALFDIFFIALPLVLIISIRTSRSVYADQQVPEKKDRSFLYITGIGCILLALLLLICFSGPTNLIKLLVAMLFTGFMGGMINRSIKLSVHTGACAGAVISIIACFGIVLLPLLVLIPMVGWSRIILNRHSIKEVLLGGIVGFSIPILTYFLLFGTLLQI